MSSNLPDPLTGELEADGPRPLPALPVQHSSSKARPAVAVLLVTHHSRRCSAVKAKGRMLLRAPAFQRKALEDPKAL